MAELDQYAMLDLIADGVRLAKPDAPETVSTRRFDSVVENDARFADLPRARSLSRIFRQGWKDLVGLSLMGPRKRGRELARRTEVEEVGWFSHEQAEFALCLVCRRLGGLASFGPGDYRREREALISARGRGSHELPLVLPTEHQIVALFGDWDAALLAAGLQARSDESGTNASAARTTTAATTTIIEVLDRCYEAHGTQPTFGELALFARANGIPFPRKEIGRPWDDYLDEWKDFRRGAGLEVPAMPPPKRARPDYGQDVGAANEGEHRIAEWDEAALVVWACSFLDELPRNRRPTLRAYANWVAQTPGAPGHSTLQRYGGFAHVLGLARSQRLKER